MRTDALASLGKTYGDGEVIVRQGELGDCVYIIQSGEVELIRREGDKEFCLGELEEGDSFGYMALFEHGTQFATVRALGEAAVLSLKKEAFLRRIHEDPSIAFRMLHKMSVYIRELYEILIRVSNVPV